VSGYFTIAHAAEKLGIPESELIESAEAGRITLVHLLRRQHHAPRLMVSAGSAETVHAFPLEWFDGDTRMHELDFRDILSVIVPKEWVYQLSQGESIWTDGAEVYGLGHRVFVWFPARLLSLADCRVPAAELEKPPETTKQNHRHHVTERRDTLEELLREIERRASNAGIPYERARHPGNSKTLWQFIVRVNPELAGRLPTSLERFKDELHAAGVRFIGGTQTANGDKFYRTLFPEVQ